jgi:WD40 repeat protein
MHQGALVVCDTDESWKSSKLTILTSIPFREPLVDDDGFWQENILSFSPDDSQIAVGFLDGQVKVWDWRSKSDAFTVGKRNARVSAILFGHDGSTVIAGYSDAKVVAWEVKSRTSRQQIDLHKDEIRGLAYSKQAGLYAVASRDNSISLWDSNSFEWLETLRGHSGICQAVAFSPDGKLLASAGQDYTVGIWPIARERYSLQMKRELGSSHFDRRSLVHNRRVYSVDSGVLMHRDINSSTYGEPAAVARDVASFSISREGILVIGTTDGRVRIQGHPAIDQNFSFQTSLPEISSIECHCSSSLVQIACTGPQGEMQCWELTDSLAPKLCFTERLQPPSKFRNENGKAMKFSGDGKLLVCEGREYSAHVYDWNSGDILHRLRGHRDRILAIAITDDTGRIATGSFDNTLRIWDLSKEDVPSRLLTGHSASVRGVQFIDGGSTLVSGAGDRTLKFWDLTSYRERLTIDTGGAVYGVEIADVDELEILSLGGGNKLFKRPSEQDVEAAIPRVTRYLDALETS